MWFGAPLGSLCLSFVLFVCEGHFPPSGCLPCSSSERHPAFPPAAVLNHSSHTCLLFIATTCSAKAVFAVKFSLIDGSLVLLLGPSAPMIVSGKKRNELKQPRCNPDCMQGFPNHCLDCDEVFQSVILMGSGGRSIAGWLTRS